MTIKVCLIEDESACQSQFLSIADTWQKENHAYLDIQVYTSAEKVLSLDTIDFHIFFLDIQLEHKNGLELQKTCGQKGMKVQLYF